MQQSTVKLVSIGPDVTNCKALPITMVTPAKSLALIVGRHGFVNIFGVLTAISDPAGTTNRKAARRTAAGEVLIWRPGEPGLITTYINRVVTVGPHLGQNADLCSKSHVSPTKWA